MGRFDNVNPSALKSGANKVLADLNNSEFSSWYGEFKETRGWRDFHKAAIETLLASIEDYYSNLREIVDVLPPMADLIQQYKELERELEQLKVQYYSASTPEERESLRYQIEAVENQMESILREIESLSNTRVTTSFAKDINANLYSHKPILIDDSYIDEAHSNYKRIVNTLESVANYFDSNSELGGASNSYVSNITRQASTIFDNMLDVFNDGKARWDTFDAAFEEAESRLDRTISSFDVPEHESVQYNDGPNTMTSREDNVESNHDVFDGIKDTGNVDTREDMLETNTDNALHVKEDNYTSTRVDEVETNLTDTRTLETKEVDANGSFAMNSNVTDKDLEQKSMNNTESSMFASTMSDAKAVPDKDSRIESTSSAINAEVNDVEMPAEKSAMKTEESRINVGEYDPSAEKNLNMDGYLNTSGSRTTSVYEDSFDR